ncbi:MAG TPA: DUF2931 family protein [Hymenobacter sp.]|uniref:DUF2931 family protein n=1 Tax=Hymenobacter sp. TaxID=1898978 RepID=UPI002EDB415E
MEPNQPEHFAFAAAPCTADGYFVTIHAGEFMRPDGKTLPVPTGHLLEGSWGASGTLWAVGDERQPAPTRLRMLWFSYAEDQFYEGDFALPQQEIQALLQQGYWDVEKQQHGTYTSLIVCTIPKGGVVLWLGGTNQTFVGRFQGQPSAVDFKQFYGPANRAKLLQEVRTQMPSDVQQQLTAGTFGVQKWDQYLRRYPWKVEISQPLTLYKYSLRYLNAERVRDPLSRDLGPYRQQLLEPSPKAMPRKLYLYGQTEHGARHQIRLNPFDEAETMAAFQTLSQANPQSPITLFIEVSKAFKKGSLTLRNERQQIPLLKTQVQLFDED